MNVRIRLFGIVFGMVGGGFVGSFVGAEPGAIIGCATMTESNLCGLIGVFVTGPIGAIGGGIGVADLGSRLKVRE